MSPTRRKSQLFWTDFTSAHLEGADLEGSKVKRCKFASTVMDGKTNLTDVVWLDGFEISEPKPARSRNRQTGATFIKFLKSVFSSAAAAVHAQNSGDNDDGSGSGSDTSGEDNDEEEEEKQDDPWQQNVEKKLDNFMGQFLVMAQVVGGATDKSLRNC